MYMNGFVWEDTNCIIYLFRSWVINSRGLLAIACISTALIGVLLEAVVWIRRKYLSPKKLICKVDGSSFRIMIPSALCYAIQLLFGYFLMLIVMTYSGPLVISVIIGLVLGNFVFLSHDVVTIKQEALGNSETLSASYSIEDNCRGLTPCCENG